MSDNIIKKENDIKKIKLLARVSLILFITGIIVIIYISLITIHYGTIYNQLSSTDIFKWMWRAHVVECTCALTSMFLALAVLRSA